MAEMVESEPGDEATWNNIVEKLSEVGVRALEWRFVDGLDRFQIICENMPATEIENEVIEAEPEPQPEPEPEAKEEEPEFADENNCPICAEPFEPILSLDQDVNRESKFRVNTPCGHRFCWSCIIQHFMTRRENSLQTDCPTCRQPLKHNSERSYSFLFDDEPEYNSDLDDEDTWWWIDPEEIVLNENDEVVLSLRWEGENARFYLHWFEGETPSVYLREPPFEPFTRRRTRATLVLRKKHFPEEEDDDDDGIHYHVKMIAKSSLPTVLAIENDLLEYHQILVPNMEQCQSCGKRVNTNLEDIIDPESLLIGDCETCGAMCCRTCLNTRDPSRCQLCVNDPQYDTDEETKET